eukprot:1808273-Amphidinium_carterae.1
MTRRRKTDTAGTAPRCISGRRDGACMTGAVKENTAQETKGTFPYLMDAESRSLAVLIRRCCSGPRLTSVRTCAIDTS